MTTSPLNIMKTPLRVFGGIYAIIVPVLMAQQFKWIDLNVGSPDKSGSSDRIVRSQISRSNCNRFPGPFNIQEAVKYPEKVMVQYKRPDGTKGIPFSINMTALQNLYPDCPEFTDLSPAAPVSVEDITFVTGASSDHFIESVDAVASIQTYFPRSRIEYFDLVLKPAQVDHVKKWCSVTYRKIRFEMYPEHVRNLHSYGFKYIVIQEALWYSKAMFWVDASIRFRSANIIELLIKARKNKGHVLLYASPHSNYAVTHPEFYKYFPSDIERLKTFSQHGSGFNFIINSRFVHDHIMSWAVACSLDEDCIAPKGSELQCNFPNDRMATYANCHRFDQSLINVILAHIFNYTDTKYSVLPHMATVHRFVTNMYKIQVCPAKVLG